MADSKKPVIRTGGDHDRAIDAAVEMLGLALRLEAHSTPARRAALLRERLSDSRGSTLRDRVVTREDASARR
jgi:hypothetical protein